MSLLDDLCVRNWRFRVGVSWPRAFRTFERFCEEVLSGDPVFGGMSPSQLVEWQVKARGREAYRLGDLAQQWINKQPWRLSTKQKCRSDISSFFLHSHASLPRDCSFHFASDVPPVEGQLDKDRFRRILHNCNKMYRAVFLMMAQGLMGEGELVYVSNNLWREILTHLTKNDGIFKVTLPGRKRNRNRKPYYTMLSTKSDWADAMRDYLRSSSHPISEALFWNEDGHPLTSYNIHYYFHWRAVEAGVIEQFTPPCRKCQGETVRTRRRGKIVYVCKECGNVDWAYGLNKNLTSVRYGVNPHEIRDLIRSRWQPSGADPVVAEFMMEHDIDPNHYNKFTKYEPWYPVQEYRKALPWLNVLSEDPEKVDRSTVDAKLETYQAQNMVLSREIAHLTQYVQTLESQLKQRTERTKLEEEVLNLLQDPKVIKQLEKLRDNIK